MKYDSLNQFMQKLDRKNWRFLSAEKRLAYLQEFENAMAEITGREPLKIQVMDAQFERSNKYVMGYFDPEKMVIVINSKYLTSRMAIPGISNYNLANALDLIAHEGRHAWQYYAVTHPEKNLIDRNTRMALQMNFENYQSNGGEYGGQLLELDARRFAREVLIKMSAEFEKMDGQPDMVFVNAIRQSKAQEVAWASALLHGVTLEKIYEMEMRARKMSEELHPGVDFSKISFFEEAKRFVKTRNVSEYLDGHSITVNGGRYFEAVDRWEDGKCFEKQENIEEIKIKTKRKFL